MPTEVDGIRQFQPQDAQPCHRIVCDCLRQDASLTPVWKESLLCNQSPANLLEYARLVYLAVYQVANQPAGVGGIDLNEIRLLFVAPEYQRRGIGSALLGHLETFVPPALFGDVFVYSVPGAEGFYRAHGYRPKGDYRFMVGTTAMPTIFMTKKLIP